MNKEHTEYLYNTYPLIFADKDLPMTQTAMCWGFDCGDGWFDIINDLCKKIQARCEEVGVEVRATQVKEKYGTLRFYIYGGDDEIYTYIDEAEEKSSTTCEICGMPGTMNEDGWIEVRCTECSKLK